MAPTLPSYSTASQYPDSDDDDTVSTTSTALPYTILAYPDGPVASTSTLTFRDSKIGGLPVFPPAAIKPEPSASHCTLCGKETPLLVQVYCPFEDSELERVVYVWACTASDCRGKDGSVRAWRASWLGEVVDEEQEEEKEESKAPVSKAGGGGGLGNLIFGGGVPAGAGHSAGGLFAGDSSAVNANPFSTSSTSLNPFAAASSNPFGPVPTPAASANPFAAANPFLPPAPAAAATPANPFVTPAPSPPSTIPSPSAPSPAASKSSAMSSLLASMSLSSPPPIPDSPPFDSSFLPSTVSEPTTILEAAPTPVVWPSSHPSFPPQYLTTAYEPAAPAASSSKSKGAKRLDDGLGHLDEGKHREGKGSGGRASSSTSGGAEGGDGWGKEGYEVQKLAGVDEVFLKFQERVVRGGGNQVLRYEHCGTPLPFSAKTSFFKKIFSVEGEDVEGVGKYDQTRVPRCKHCGEESVYELQLMPGLVGVVNKLAAKKSGGAEKGKAAAAAGAGGLKELEGETALDFATVMVFSCFLECCDDDRVGWKEETVMIEVEQD